MNEKLNNNTLNDEISQFIHASHLSNAEILQIRSCDHLFVTLDKAKHSYGTYYPAKEECVKCGLTNKFFPSPTTGIYFATDAVIKSRLNYTNLYRKEYEWHKKHNQTHKTLSKKSYYFLHSKILYEIAKNIFKNTDNEEIFNTMYELQKISTPTENARIHSIEDCKELIYRYKFYKEKLNNISIENITLLQKEVLKLNKKASVEEVCNTIYYIFQLTLPNEKEKLSTYNPNFIQTLLTRYKLPASDLYIELPSSIYKKSKNILKRKLTKNYN